MGDFDPDAAASPGAGIFGLDHDERSAEVVVIPVPFEATVSYGHGTAEGPDLIRTASHQIDLFDQQTGHPYRAGIFMQPPMTSIVALAKDAKAAAQRVISGLGTAAESDADIARVNEASRLLNQWVHEEVRGLLKKRKRAVVVGGDHSVAFGAIRAHAEHYEDIGLVQFDAHADLRVAYEGFEYSHASVMERVLDEIPGVSSLVQFGIRDLGVREAERIERDSRVHAAFAIDLEAARLQGAWVSVVDALLSQLPDRVYVSFDIDGLDPHLCPGTGTPVPGGLSFNEAALILDRLVKSGRTIVGCDLCEVAGGEWDGNVGARILYKLIGFMGLSHAE